MMTRKERAKQFMPFDAMKGLQEALRAKEERHMRTQKREISQEDKERNSKVLSDVRKGMKISVDFWCAFHDVTLEGTVTAINFVYKFLKIDDCKINFDDVYKITITEYF